MLWAPLSWKVEAETRARGRGDRPRPAGRSRRSCSRTARPTTRSTTRTRWRRSRAPGSSSPPRATRTTRRTTSGSTTSTSRPLARLARGCSLATTVCRSSAPPLPATPETARRPTSRSSMTDRVRDISEVLDELPDGSAVASTPSRAGVLGHSRGTVTHSPPRAAARPVGLRRPEPRVKAIMGMAIGARNITLGVNLAERHRPDAAGRRHEGRQPPRPGLQQVAYDGDPASTDKPLIESRAQPPQFDSTYCEQMQSAGAAFDTDQDGGWRAARSPTRPDPRPAHRRADRRSAPGGSPARPCTTARPLLHEPGGHHGAGRGDAQHRVPPPSGRSAPPDDPLHRPRRRRSSCRWRIWPSSSSAPSSRAPAAASAAPCRRRSRSRSARRRASARSSRAWPAPTPRRARRP